MEPIFEEAREGKDNSIEINKFRIQLAISTIPEFNGNSDDLYRFLSTVDSILDDVDFKTYKFISKIVISYPSYCDLALAVFVKGLPLDLKIIVKAAKPENLKDAMHIAAKEEKYLNIRSDKKYNPFVTCRYCKKRGHHINQCRKLTNRKRDDKLRIYNGGNDDRMDYESNKDLKYTKTYDDTYKAFITTKEESEESEEQEEYKEESLTHNTKIEELTTIASPSKESIETLSALEIAEQMTYLDHQIFMSIRSEEFLGQAWMKSDKAVRAPHILLMTRRFNDVSRLVVSEIVRRPGLQARTQAIEKWAAVADISRCLHNFNGVLQVCAAFTNSSVFRLKKTWEKVSKTTRQTIAKLQRVVSSDGRFRVLRDALHRCDPPCIPYLGLYLTDLSFIEEGTPDFTPDGLLNFSKMRMIAHVIREIRHFQQTPYKIENIPKVTNYLLDASLLLDDDELYRLSLQIEPRTSRLGTTN
ncbi:ras-specific guanine nucleotide-releasing factor 2-like [Ctenocephalides felis]|uniref:ras-specific guanine nucleotide-releasing factor 2-like n=1 Tax=Ctenocephalides felis TaxID=7515 RepID=UPI000E6E41D4|nr:ras-specific guanine nucleotide-releasing factor 2-like [Ctenocephalides felis]